MLPPVTALNCTCGSQKCYYYGGQSIGLNSNQVAVVYSVTKDYLHYSVYGQIINDISLRESFFITNRATEIKDSDVKISNYGSDSFVLALTNKESELIEIYTYKNSLLLDYIELPCINSCELVALLPTYQKDGFFIAYNNEIGFDYKTQTQVFYNGIPVSDSNTLMPYAQNNKAHLNYYATAQTFINDNFFVTDGAQGVVVNSKNGLLGDVFFATFLLEIYSANRLDNGDLLLLGYDINAGTGYLSSVYINTHDFPVARPNTFSTNEKWASLSNQGFKSTPSVYAQISLISILLNQANYWFSLNTQRDFLHTISEMEKVKLLHLNEKINYLKEELFSFRYSNLSHNFEVARALIDESIQKIKNILDVNKLSKKSIGLLQKNISEINSLISSIKNDKEKFNRRELRHWTNFSVWKKAENVKHESSNILDESIKLKNN